MSRHIQINLALTPIINYDAKTHSYIIYYREFPQAIACGSNENEAENNLIFLLEDMWHKRQDDIKQFLTTNFPDKIQINKPADC